MNLTKNISQANLTNNNISSISKNLSGQFRPKQLKSINKSASLRNTSTRSFYYENKPMPKETIHWNMSASTLRNSIKSHLFSRSSRFSQYKPNYKDSSKIQKPSLLSTRSTTFGYGNKVKIPQSFGYNLFKQTKNCPLYDSDINSIQRSASANLSLKKGKTFGKGWDTFKAVFSPHRATVSSSYQVKSNPGPNRYNNNQNSKSPYHKVTMHRRLSMFTTLNANYKLSQPNPQTYEIKQDLVKRVICGKGIGKGTRTDFTKQSRNIPGPVYKLSNFCDKFTHLKVKLNQI